jgi:hypothetical protein
MAMKKEMNMEKKMVAKIERVEMSSSSYLTLTPMVAMVLEMMLTITDNHLLTMKLMMVKEIEVSKINDAPVTWYNYSSVEHIRRVHCICIRIEMRAAAASEPVADDPYLRIVLGCAHEQKAHIHVQWCLQCRQIACKGYSGLRVIINLSL